MAIFLFFLLFLSCSSGFVLSATVTLDSIEIYKTHEVLKAVKPQVYFRCKGENGTDLPDVKKSNQIYKFKGEESWQPLTELSDKKCKRCGFYEEDMFKSDDVYDEWEFCPSDFAADGTYVRFKDKEFNATFSCPLCVPVVTSSSSSSDSHRGKGMHIALIILISVLVSTAFIIGLIVAFKYWQKKKREQDQARFLKLFEEGDDIEDELELGNVL